MIQRNFWRNVLPSVIAFAFSGVYSIVDGMFVGQGVGDAGLAAINVAWPVTALVQALGTGLGMAAAVVLSVCIGRRDAAEEHRALGSTAVLLLLAGVLSTALLALLYRPLLPLLGAEGSVLAYTATPGSSCWARSSRCWAPGWSPCCAPMMGRTPPCAP